MIRTWNTNELHEPIAASMAGRTRYAVLVICCSSLFLASLDNTIVNVALPSIAKDLDSSLSTLQWTVDAYLLVLASLLLFSGSIADRFGRKRVFVTGLIVFTFGSAMCGLASSEVWLVGFRMVQAVGGSMMTPVALAIVTNVFTAPAERARAIGWWAAVSGIGIAAGPLIGGFLVDSVGWRSIFWINVPTGIAAAILAFAVVPESKAASPRAFDPVGQILVVTLLVSVVFGIIEGPNRGWASPLIAGCFVVAASTLLALVRYERRQRQPLVQVGLFTTASFAGSFVMAMVGFLSFAGLLFANTLYLQNVLDLAASQAGLVTLPLALATIIAAPLSGRLMARSGARRPLVFAGVAMAAGPLILLLFTETTPLVWLAVPYLVFGAGYGMLNAPINDTAISDLPDDQAGVGAGMISTAKQVGSALGIAIVGTILVSGTGGSLATGFVTASTLAWWLLAACGATIAIIGARASGTPLPAGNGHAGTPPTALTIKDQGGESRIA